MRKKKVAIMIGSKSDLEQCRLGLEWLMQHGGETIDLDSIKFIINSIHRNTEEVLNNIQMLVENGYDFVIVGAGWANHLTGTVDAYLRYVLRNAHLRVIGVAFADQSIATSEVKHKRNTAAVLSMTEVPGTNVIFKDDEKNDEFFSAEGFLRACCLVATCDMAKLPDIELKKPKPVEVYYLLEIMKMLKGEEEHA